jgi:hypothetical protein
MHLFDHRGIARESARIKALHLTGELGDFLLHSRISLRHLAEAAKLPHLLLKAAFGVSRVCGWIAGCGLLGRTAVTIVPRIDVVPHSAISAHSTAKAHIAASSGSRLIAEVSTQARTCAVALTGCWLF